MIIMRNFRMNIFRHLVIFFGLCIVPDLASQDRLAVPNAPNTIARAGQSEIIINAENSIRDIAVWINGTIAAHVHPRSKEMIIVQNGHNVIEAADTTLARNGQWNIGTRRQVTVNSHSNCIIIGMTLRYGALLSLNVQSTTALTGNGSVTPAAVTDTAVARMAPTAPPAPPVSGGSIEHAVIRAAHELMDSLPDGSRLAVLSISSNDPYLSEFIIDELVFLIVNARRFTVVDRRNLDLIRAEANFQLSGDVDDNSAVALGRQLGASIVITGNVSGTGSTRRLRARALDVQTAVILAMASEQF